MGIEYQNKYKLITLIVPLFFIVLASLGFSISENAFFYTLSSVSQTLAALIGIIGAFTIFHVSKLEDVIKRLTESLSNRLQDYPYCGSGTDIRKQKFVDKIYDYSDGSSFLENVEFFITHLDKTGIEKGNHEINIEIVLNKTIEAIRIRDNLKQSFYIPLKYGVVAIISSLLLLSLGKIRYPSQPIVLLPDFIVDAVFLEQLKLVFIGLILYFTFVSIISSIIYLDELLE